jgi:Fe-S-cluster-containing hydrogenase component 2
VDAARYGTCGGCVAICPFAALNLDENRVLADEIACMDCDICVAACTTGALSLEASVRLPAGPAGLSSYAALWHSAMGRRLERNYRLKEKYGTAARLSVGFLKVFALAAAGT